MDGDGCDARGGAERTMQILLLLVIMIINWLIHCRTPFINNHFMGVDLLINRKVFPPLRLSQIKEDRRLVNY